MDPNHLGSVSDIFENMQVLLKANDDTSRFVGLALLKSVLDNSQFVQDRESLLVIWESLSSNFLDRLLRAQQNKSINMQEANCMVDLAVSVLHTFVILLPETSLTEKRLTARIVPLIKALLYSSSETNKLILQSLLTIVSHYEGSIELLDIQDLSPLLELASQDPLVLDILHYAWANVAVSDGGAEIVRQSIDKIIPVLIVCFKDTDAVTFLNSVGNLFLNLERSAFPQNPPWLKPLVLILRRLISSKPTPAGRVAYTKLAAVLLHTWPETYPALLFKDDPDGPTSSVDSKPFSYLFVNLLLIDLRSSFPSLLSQLNSPQYPETSQRLASAFDILSGFIGFLVRSLDNEASQHGLSISPDLLLRLNKDIAETISLTIEYLRDRWDASIAGASGLHVSARSSTVMTSQGTRLAITWESMKDNVSADPLVLAGIRALALWIRENENENLRSESAGLMDMWIELYKMGDQGPLDFRYPIALALEGILTTDEGLEEYLGQNGWQVMYEDLAAIVRGTIESEMSFTSSDASRGLQLIRVLLAVLDHPNMAIPEENWMLVVKCTAGIKVSHELVPSVVIEFHIAMLQLSVALLSKAAGGMTKRYITDQAPLSGLIRQLRHQFGNMNMGIDHDELMALLEDVDLELENLR